MEKGKTGLKKLLAGEKQINTDDIFSLLSDRTFAPDDRLPDTGVGLERERMLSSLFITSDIYGTRSSSIILIDRSHEVSFTERSFIRQDPGSFKQKTRKFNLKLSG